MLAITAAPATPAVADATSAAARWRAAVQSAPGRVVLPMRAPQLGASAVAARPGGGVLAFGVVSGTLATAALLPDGRLDPSYGEGGVALSRLAVEPRKLFLLPDGKLLVAAIHPIEPTRTTRPWLLVRLMPDGAPDTSFGNGGVVEVPGVEANFWGMAPQRMPDGDLVLPTIAGSLPPLMAGLLRVHADGSRVAGFGAGGLARIPTGVYVQSFAADADGSLIAIVSDAPLSRATRRFVVRITAAGEFDPGFGGGTPRLISASVGDIAIGADGAITLLMFEAPSVRSALLRLRADGLPDASWGVGGLTDLGSRWFSKMVPTGDGGLLLVRLREIGAPPAGSNRQQIVRVSPTGQVDPSLGGAGGLIVTLPFGGGRFEPGTIADLRQNGFSPSDVTPRSDGSLLFDGVVDAAQERYTNAGTDVLASAGGIGIAALNGSFAVDPSFRGASPLRLALTITSRRLTSRGLALALTSSGAALSVVTAKAGGRTIARATVPFLVKARSKTRTLTTHQHVRLALTPAGRRLVRRRGRVTVAVTMRATDLAGNRVTRRASSRIAR